MFVKNGESVGLTGTINIHTCDFFITSFDLNVNDPYSKLLSSCDLVDDNNNK